MGTNYRDLENNAIKFIFIILNNKRKGKKLHEMHKNIIIIWCNKSKVSKTEELQSTAFFFFFFLISLKFYLFERNKIKTIQSTVYSIYF